jgi:very-short-patch-repair endonuclease
MPDVIIDSHELSRTTRFVKFLREAVAIKTKQILEVQKYPGVIWFGDLPADFDELRSPLITPNWPATDPHWLKVARVQEPIQPKPPVECKPWLEGVDLDSPAVPPALNPDYEHAGEGDETVTVPVSPQAQHEWQRFVEGEWSRWADMATVARAVRPVYQRLFAIQQQMQGVADNFELFIGVGLFHSRTTADQPFRRHLLAFPAEVVLDDRTGTLSVGPANDFIAARLETDFLPVTDRARLQSQIDQLQDDVMSLGAGLGDQVSVGNVLTRLITPINAVTRYVSDLKPAEAAPNAAVVSFGAALILRPRSTRSLEALLKKIEADTTGEAPRFVPGALPIPWRKMMEDGRVWGGDRARDGGNATGAESGRVYFPLPSNEEQSRIVSCAEGAPGVVVQGPPGTGKSHTIANLISHYLAMGRRVLVTAQSAQALDVLRDKMPSDLQQLCVTLLGDSRASDRDLRRSVDGILTRQQDFRPSGYQERTQRLERQLTESETRVNDLERLLHHARAAETQVVEPLPTYRGTRAQIARTLREERVLFEWFPDAVKFEAPCPSYAGTWEALASYHASLHPDAQIRLARELVDLPFKGEEAVAVVEAIRLAAAASIFDSRHAHGSQLPSHAQGADLTRVAEWLGLLAEAEAATTTEDSVWISLLRRVLLRSIAMWEARLEECRGGLEQLTDAVVSAMLPVQVSEKTTEEAKRDLVRLEEHYAKGGVRRRLGLLKPRVVTETDWVETAVRVGGLPIQRPEEVSRARRALDGWALLDDAWKPWSNWASARDGSPRVQVAILTNRLRLVERFLAVAGRASDVTPQLRLWLAGNLDADVPTATLSRVVEQRVAELRLLSARAHRDTLLSSLYQAIGNRDVVPALRRLVTALINESSAEIVSALNDLDTEIGARKDHKRYVDFVNRVRDLAPIFAETLVSSEGTSALRSALADFERAWAHRRAQDWLDTMLSDERIEASHRAARDERQRQQETLAEVTSTRAWARALERITDLRRATLTGWAQAVARIPASGPNVFIRRAQAQRLLGGCLDSIPAWVVSLGRLYETVDPAPGLFDVAIVDEASQCWLDSLVLFYLAKQVIIVGDDKQISPTVVGVADTEIDKLAEAFLSDFQFRSSFSLGSSLFDHGRRYLSDGVPLREHFRCVPEIISFSNVLCYQANPLIPLRQVSRKRLEPLKRTYLPNGLRARDVNDVEAEAIVSAIAGCDADPSYEDCDFGVICLQGDMQGERIEQLLLERLGPEVFKKRRLRCGNPYAFQGDERDVMFLSMVAAPNVRQQSLTTAMYEQRFNVAMSRARDQAWLFHSIQEDELGANCLRRRVLEFFKSPPDQSINGTSVDIPHLRLAAARADRRAERPPRPFESWFELDVALALAARGFTLSTQVEVARKRIDLVIEGDEGVRLAVECDGEAWHGADEYAADLARQRQLERAGWRFVRVRESLFYSDETRAIRDVIDACEELEIAAGDGRARLATNALDEAPRVGVTERSRVPELRAESQVANQVPIAVEDDEDEEPDFHLASSRSETSMNPRLPLDSIPGRDYPDPRSAPIATVREAVLDVIKNHGPLTKSAIYGHYRDGCPKLERAGKNLRQAVNSALASMERTDRIESRDEGKRRLATEVVYRLPDQPWVSKRPALGRNLDDVPLSELAVEIIANGGLTVRDDEDELESLLKDIARRYGVQRFREQARTRLAAAAELAFDAKRSTSLGLT